MVTPVTPVTPLAPPFNVQRGGEVVGAIGEPTPAEAVPAHGSHFGPGTIHIIPASPTVVGSCIPFGSNLYGFKGFIYRNVPAFTLPAGGKFAFDLGRLNGQPIKRDIYLSAANMNPALPPPSFNTPTQGVAATGWVKVASESQTPLNPFGNTISGDYELTYTAEATFTFGGGGLLVGFAGSPPAAIPDGGCEQVLVFTDNADASGQFYARFWGMPHLHTGVIDNITGGGSGMAIGGMVIQNCLAPTVSVSASPTDLWPPNHKYVPVALAVTVNDPCNGTVIAKAWSDEPDDANGNGDGATTGDVKAGTNLSSNASPVVAFNHGTDQLELRAERAGAGGARTYTIEITVTNATGSASATATVKVAYNQGQ